MKQLKALAAIAIINFIASGIYIALALPDKVFLHVNAAMVVDRVGSKWIYLIFSGVYVLISVAAFFFAKKAMPRTNQRVTNILLYSITVFFILITWGTLISASIIPPVLGTKADNIKIDFWILFPLGVLFVIISNFFGKVKRNRFLGIRTPWTLKDETVWKKTHRLAGYTGVSGGFAVILGALLGSLMQNPYVSLAGLLSGIFLIGILPAAHSFALYRKIHKTRDK